MPGDSSTGTALLRAIHLAPDDDAPRLVYADYVEENGDSERAKLIRWMVRVPSYRFFWRQSRWAKRPKHEHKEAIKAIRGLRPRLSALCREEWGARPGVEEVVMCSGFAESITLPAHEFLATAAGLGAAHPFQTVHLSDLRAWLRAEWLGTVGARLSAGPAVDDHWLAVLFPERTAGDVVTYPDRDVALADLSRRAAGYGRRAAGVMREPPPLPAPPPPPRIEGYGIGHDQLIAGKRDAN